MECRRQQTARGSTWGIEAVLQNVSRRLSEPIERLWLKLPFQKLFDQVGERTDKILVRAQFLREERPGSGLHQIGRIFEQYRERSNQRLEKAGQSLRARQLVRQWLNICGRLREFACSRAARPRAIGSTFVGNQQNHKIPEALFIYIVIPELLQCIAQSRAKNQAKSFVPEKQFM